MAQSEKEEEAWRYLDQGRELKFQSKEEEAVAAFNYALAVDPNGKYAAWIWREKGLALVHLHRWAEAVQSFREAIRLNPQDDTSKSDLQYALNIMNNPKSKNY